MAKSYSLAAYLIRIKNKTTHSNVSLDEFQIDGLDIFDVFFNYFEERQAASTTDNVEEKLLRVQNYQADDKLRLIKGNFETGEYGIRSDFYNIETQELTIHRELTDAELLPFYFLLSLSQHTQEGIIILQRFHTHGIKTVVQRDLQEYFKEITDDYSIQLIPIIYEALLDQYINGELKEIRLVKFNLPKHLETQFQTQGANPEEAVAEFVLKAKHNTELEFGKQKIADYLRSLRNEVVVQPLNRIIAVHGFSYDTIKIDIIVNGKRRKMDLSNPYQISAYYDITDELRFENGRPLFTSIDAIAQDYLDSLENRMLSNNSDE